MDSSSEEVRTEFEAVDERRSRCSPPSSDEEFDGDLLNRDKMLGIRGYDFELCLMNDGMWWKNDGNRKKSLEDAKCRFLTSLRHPIPIGVIESRWQITQAES